MSAIAGLVNFNGQPISPAPLKRMVELQAYRGPDGTGTWTDGQAGLGHGLLRTTPESLSERQPVLWNGIAVTADVRLDNREELISLLGLDNRTAEKIGDAEMIVRAYDKWGEDCPRELEGDFAFAIWDSRRRMLFCARDSFGVKPFYYRTAEQRFAFASQIRPLLYLEGGTRRLCETRVADFLVPILEDRTITFYEGIRRLPPGALLSLTGGPEAPPRTYWCLDPERETRLRSDGEYDEAFRDHFFRAVRRRLRSAFPVGSLLSGGLDTSAIVCAMQHLSSNSGLQIHAFSAVFPGVAKSDERDFISAVVKRSGATSHDVQAADFTPLADLVRLFDRQDEVPWVPNLFWLQGLYHAAGRAGVRCLFDGQDGDSTVSHGLYYLVELLRAGRWWALVRELRGLRHTLGRRSTWHYLRRYALRPLVPETMATAWRRIHRSRPWWAIDSIVDPTFALRIGLEERAQRLAEAPIPRSEREAHWRGMTSGVDSYVLEILDRAAAAASVEPRYPFFDRQLVEFCVSLPGSQKIRHGWTRQIMRRSLAGLLPQPIRARGGKADLSPTFVRGLRQEHVLLDAIFLHDCRALEPYVNLVVLRRIYHRFMVNSHLPDALTIWKAATLALWLKWAGFADIDSPRQTCVAPEPR